MEGKQLHDVEVSTTKSPLSIYELESPLPIAWSDLSTDGKCIRVVIWFWILLKILAALYCFFT
eukprot:TRINITY_DN15121_c0_g1_i1.p2 TRINITY_DN15121_c0_g1~~TRINITY_DN15121_c0_g1_i1.p2  ORF type:complete len:63 (-),score=7.32 TRINITY_DN15121_c0_g1_i1:44-232(-)